MSFHWLVKNEERITKIKVDCVWIFFFCKLIRRLIDLKQFTHFASTDFMYRGWGERTGDGGADMYIIRDLTILYFFFFR